jgi:hypothetical protein
VCSAFEIVLIFASIVVNPNSKVTAVVLGNMLFTQIVKVPVYELVTDPDFSPGIHSER